MVEAFLDSISKPATVLTADGQIMSSNESFRGFWEVPVQQSGKKLFEEELFVQNGFEVKNWVKPETWKYAASLGEGESLTKKGTLLKNGKAYHFTLMFEALPPHFNNLHPKGKHFLVTYQQQSEETQALFGKPSFNEEIFGLLKLDVLFFGLDLQIKVMNRHALDSFGMTPSEAARFNITDFLEVESFPSELLQQLEKGDPPAAALSMPISVRVIKGKKQPYPAKLWLSSVQNQPEPVYIAIIHDTTAVHALQEKLRKLTNAVENSPSVVVITDKEGKIEYANKRFTELTGYSLEETVGLNPRILKSGSQGSGFYEGLWAKISAGEVWKGEFHNKKKNGEYYWERAAIAPIRDEKDEITHFVAIKENITESKEAAEELKRKEFVYRKLVQHLPGIGVLLFDENLQYILSEGIAFQELGVVKEKVENRSAHEVLSEDDRDSAIYAYQKALKGESVFSETTINGRVYDVKILPIRDEKLKVLMGMSVISDITELRKAEERIQENFEFLQTIFKTIPNAFFYKDMQGKYLDCNEKFSANYNLDIKDVIGKTDFEIAPESLARTFYKKDQELIRRKTKQVYEVNIENRGSMKSGFYIVHKALFYRKDGTAAGIVGIVHNLTYRKEYEREMERQNLELKELDREKDSLMSIVAHDLKSPLSKVQGLATLIGLSGKLDEEQREYLKIMQQVTQNGTDLIRDLLDISTFENRAPQLSFEAIGIKSFVENLLESFLQQAKQKYIQLGIECQPPNFIFRSDSSYLSRIIDNLISNAIKFSKAKTCVTVSFKLAKEVLLISVKDEGPGISKEDQQMMFKKFQKLSARPTGNEHSTGLGLSIIKVLVERLKGTIQVNSDLGIGTEFIITIPEAKQ